MSQTIDRCRRAEAGSAYIIALLVLVVLSLLGLSLAMVSQTEMQIGANELSTHRTFYGSQGGIGLAEANLLTVNSSIEGVAMAANGIDAIVSKLQYDVPERRLTLDSSGNVITAPTVPGATTFVERVVPSPMLPIRAVPCDMCPAAEGDVKLVNTNHALVTNAQRLAVGSATTTTAQKQLYLMVGVQPWWKPDWDALADSTAMQTVTQQTLGAQ